MFPTLRRAAAVSQRFVPPSQLYRASPNFSRQRLIRRAEDGKPLHKPVSTLETDSVVLSKPASPSFYTGGAPFYDQMATLEKANSILRNALKAVHLLPLPDFAEASLLPLKPMWKSAEMMSTQLNTKLRVSQYRRLIHLLNEMLYYQRIVMTAGYTQLTRMIEDITITFESDVRDPIGSKGPNKKRMLDPWGRSYARGRRKTSSARVWMIPATRPDQPTLASVQASPQEIPSSLSNPSQDLGTNPEKSQPTDIFKPSAEMSRETLDMPTSTILVNNFPLGQYFDRSIDRDRVVRPLKVAGVIGKYNLFVLVRGGGTTGQSGAIANGIAKALVVFEPGLESLMRQARLYKRDPRMVERKKPGQAKARKKYAWVRR